MTGSTYRLCAIGLVKLTLAFTMDDRAQLLMLLRCILVSIIDPILIVLTLQFTQTSSALKWLLAVGKRVLCGDSSSKAFATRVERSAMERTRP